MADNSAALDALIAAHLGLTASMIAVYGKRAEVLAAFSKVISVQIENTLDPEISGKLATYEEHLKTLIALAGSSSKPQSG